MNSNDQMVLVDEEAINLRTKAKALFDAGELRQSTLQRMANDYSKVVIDRIIGGDIPKDIVHDVDIESISSHASIRTQKMVESDWNKAIESGNLKNDNVKLYDSTYVRSFTPESFMDGEEYAEKKYGRKAIDIDELFFPETHEDPSNEYFF